MYVQQDSQTQSLAIRLKHFLATVVSLLMEMYAVFAIRNILIVQPVIHQTAFHAIQDSLCKMVRAISVTLDSINV